MAATPPSDYYTGLVADSYGHLRGERFDAAPYERFVRRSGEPALELGCGDGEPILDLLAAGLHVEGVDSSADMLARCQAAADRRGLDVVLHHAPMESMRLARRYRSIYLAGATFNLLPDDDATLAALLRILGHLEAGGMALVPLFVPAPTPEGDIGAVREHVADEEVLRVTVTSVRRDEATRTQVTGFRYERVERGEVVDAADREWVLHWHTQDGFRALAAAAGLTSVAVLGRGGGAAATDASSFTFLLRADASRGNT